MKTEKRHTCTNMGNVKDSNYDGNYTSRHFQRKTYEMSGRWVFVEKCTTVSKSAINWTARITTNTVKDRETVVLLALTVTTACMEEFNRLQPYGSPQTLTNEAQKCSVHKAEAKGHHMFICNVTHPFLKIPPFSHSTYSILVHFPTNGDNPFSKGSRLFISFLKWESWHIQNTWVLYRIHLK